MASEVEVKIQACIHEGKSFVLDAGAGSGKTWTLVQSLRYLIEEKGSEFKMNNQHIVCITYTNVAKNEIIERIEYNDLVIVNTIHDFLWSCIKGFNKELKTALVACLNNKKRIEEHKLLECSSRAIKKRKGLEEKIEKLKFQIEKASESCNIVSYEQYPNYEECKISHDDVIEISEYIFATYPKLIKLTIDAFPVIFVDEYQDTQNSVINILLKNIYGSNNIVLGFFGDKMQKIYETGIGEIPSEFGLTQIAKKENYRCSISVINLLNNIRSDIQQEPAAKNLEGSAVFYHISNCDYNVDTFINNVLKQNIAWGNCNIKRLYLTHKLIAKANCYIELFDLYSKYGKYGKVDCLLDNKSNTACPFANILFDFEQMIQLYTEGNIQSLLKRTSYKVGSFKDRTDLRKIFSDIVTKRNILTIGEIIDYLKVNKISIKLKEILDFNYNDNEKMLFYENLRKINYSQFIRVNEVVEKKTPFSTKHGTKGDEFNNVLVVIDDAAWNRYKFNDYFSGDMNNLKRYNRTKNLFYVSCSRAINHLAVLCLSELSDTAISHLKSMFGDDSVIKL